MLPLPPAPQPDACEETGEVQRGAAPQQRGGAGAANAVRPVHMRTAPGIHMTKNPESRWGNQICLRENLPLLNHK